MASAESRGWGKGWPASRLADMVPLSYITGRVHRDIHELCELLCAETVRRGYTIRRDWSWGYANRPIAGTQTASNHSWGLAVDLNAPANPMRRPLTTDMPSWLPDLWRSYGFRWGGDYTSTPDPMHFEFMGTPGEAAIQTKRARTNLGAKPVSKQGPFKDVAAGHVHADAIAACAAAGLLQGYKDGTFRPDGRVTRAQLAAVLHRAGLTSK